MLITQKPALSSKKAHTPETDRCRNLTLMLTLKLDFTLTLKLDFTKPLPSSTTDTDYDTLTMTTDITTPICNSHQL